MGAQDLDVLRANSCLKGSIVNSQTCTTAFCVPETLLNPILPEIKTSKLSTIKQYPAILVFDWLCLGRKKAPKV